jgi:hypothetical protein
VPSPTIRLFIEGFLGHEQSVAQAAGVPGQGDAGLDGRHPAGAVLGVAFGERRREIRPPRCTVADWYIAGANPVAEYRCSASWNRLIGRLCAANDAALTTAIPSSVVKICPSVAASSSSH